MGDNRHRAIFELYTRTVHIYSARTDFPSALATFRSMEAHVVLGMTSADHGLLSRAESQSSQVPDKFSFQRWI